MHRLLRSTLVVCVLGGFVGCAGKNPSNPDHRRSAEEQETIDNICGAELDEWKTQFANESAVLGQIRSGETTVNGREIMRAVAADTRRCDSKTYRACRICMELESTGKCPQLQAGMMEYCLEKEAGVSDENEGAAEEPAEPAEPAEEE